jgi:hypothetical protein
MPTRRRDLHSLDGIPVAHHLGEISGIVPGFGDCGRHEGLHLDRFELGAVPDGGVAQARDAHHTYARHQGGLVSVECLDLAKRLGYDVVEVFEDNDISASTKSPRERPGYSEMLNLARAGHFDAILAYSNSRLTPRAGVPRPH